MRGYRRLFQRALTEKQLDRELRFHLEQQIAGYAAEGMTPDEARRRARLEFGGLDQTKEEFRYVGAARFVETLIQDGRYGLRQLRRNPRFTAMAIITLALGVGANTAIFSVANAVFQQGLPAQEPDRILGLSFHQRSDLGQRNFSYTDFEDIRQQANSCSDLFAYRIGLDGLKTGDRAEQVITSFVTGNYFTTLGPKPVLGLLILPSEGRCAGI